MVKEKLILSRKVGYDMPAVTETIRKIDKILVLLWLKRKRKTFNSRGGPLV